MEYANSAPYLYMAMNTVADLAKKAVTQGDDAGRHTLEEASDSRASDYAGVPEAQSDASWEQFLIKKAPLTRPT